MELRTVWEAWLEINHYQEEPHGPSVNIEGRRDGAEYRGILQESLLQSVKKKERLMLGRNFILQEDNDPKHKVKGSQERFKIKMIYSS